VNKCSRKQEIITIFHHLSSPPVTNFEIPHHLFKPGAKVSHFASLPWLYQVGNCFLLGFFLPFDFTMRVSV
jgi:hypothetical protein